MPNRWLLVEAKDFEAAPVLKLHEGRPNVLDLIKNRQVQLILNTSSGSAAHTDGRLIQRSAQAYNMPLITTIAGLKQRQQAIATIRNDECESYSGPSPANEMNIL